MELNRLFLHIPVGLVTVALIYANTGLGVLFGAGFIAYEIMQEKREPRPWRGESHLDIKGWLWGVVIAGVVWLILKAVL